MAETETNKYWIRFELFRKGTEIDLWTTEKFLLKEKTLSEAKKEFKKLKKFYRRYKTIKNCALVEEKVAVIKTIREVAH